jgi:hypothetical protein
MSFSQVTWTEVEEYLKWADRNPTAPALISLTFWQSALDPF